MAFGDDKSKYLGLDVDVHGDLLETGQVAMRMPLFQKRLLNVDFVTELLALNTGKRRLCSFSVV